MVPCKSAKDGDSLEQPSRVEVEAGPRGRDGARVLSRKQRGNQEARDLLIRGGPVWVLVAGVDESL
jgi:hypothetical protein